MDSRFEGDAFRDLRGKDTGISVLEHDDDYFLIMSNKQEYIQIDLDEKQVSDLARKSNALLTPEWAIDAGRD